MFRLPQCFFHRILVLSDRGIFITENWLKVRFREIGIASRESDLIIDYKTSDLRVQRCPTFPTTDRRVNQPFSPFIPISTCLGASPAFHHGDRMSLMRFYFGHVYIWVQLLGPTRLELTQLSMLQRDLPEMVMRVSKGE